MKPPLVALKINVNFYITYCSNSNSNTNTCNE